MFRRRVRSLEDWTPETPIARIDIPALIADMRTMGIPTIDDAIGECLDDDDEAVLYHLKPHHCLRLEETARRLSHEGRLRLISYGFVVAEAVCCLDARDALPERPWALAIFHAQRIAIEAGYQLDDGALRDIERALQIRLLRPEYLPARGAINLMQLAVGGLPEAISDTQHQSLRRMVDLIDEYPWRGSDLDIALTGLEKPLAMLGRRRSDTRLFVRAERAIETAERALAYIFEGVSPALMDAIEAVEFKSWDDQYKKQQKIRAEIEILPPSQKSNILGMLVDISNRTSQLANSQVEGFPSHEDYASYRPKTFDMLARFSRSSLLSPTWLHELAGC